MMTDAELFGQTPSAAPAPTPSAATPSGDPAVWTVLGEAGADPEGQKAVASTIANRQRGMGVSSAGAVVTDPANGYEAWQSKAKQLQTQYPVGSPAYQKAVENIGGILSGSQPSPYPYTHFYSPTAQSADKRPVPKWDDGTGIDIGGNRFFTQPVAPPPGLTAAEAAQWEALGGAKQAVKMEATSDTPNPGAVPDPQANTVRFMEAQGLRDTGAEPGSSSNPLAQPEGGDVPSKPGTYFIGRDGSLQTIQPDGTSSGDLRHGLMQIASERAQAEAQPITTRLAQGGGQGAMDVAGSVNNLTGGGMAAGGDFPMATALRDVNAGGPATSMLAQGSQAETVRQRNAFDILHGGDPAATVGRVGGQAATMAPLFALGGAGAEAGADAVANVAPKVRSALDFLLGNGGDNLGTQILSKAAAGAPQGAAVGALTSSTSDRPVGQQIAQGAEMGGVAGGLAPVASAAGSKIARALIGPDIPGPIASLATKAIDTYGIPLRTSQIAGTVDRNAAMRDSEMIGQVGTGFAKNAAAQRTAFTRAVAGTFGADADNLTPPVLSAARQSLGAKFNAFAANHSIPDANSVMTNLGGIVQDAQQSMPASEVAPLIKQVENIGELAKDGQISGQSYQNLVRSGSPLDRAMQSGDSNLRYYAGKMKDALDDGMAQSATPEELADFANTRLQYKNLMTIKGLAAKSGITGEISPVQLQTMVNRSFDDRAFSGAGRLGDLADIGQMFMKEPPQSGTAPRLISAIKRNALGLGLSGGALGESALLHDPALAAKLAGAAALAGGARLAGNVASGAINNSDIRTRLMINGPGKVGNALRGVTTRLSDLIAPAYVPGSALAGIQLSHPQPQLAGQ